MFAVSARYSSRPHLIVHPSTPFMDHGILRIITTELTLHLSIAKSAGKALQIKAYLYSNQKQRETAI
jgi:hypothetical protein